MNGIFGGDAVRLGQENDPGFFREEVGFWFAKPERGSFRMTGEFREDLSQRLACILPRGDGCERRSRVSEQEPHEFFAGIAGGTDNSYCVLHDMVKSLPVKTPGFRHAPQ